MTDGRELELKFEVAPEKAAAFRARSLRHLGGRDGVRERLASVYFDTRKHALEKKGLSLRIRSAGDRRLQTIKETDRAGAGLFDRPEWESEVAGDVPDLGAAAGTPVGKVLAGRLAQDLRPIFAVEVDRTTWIVATEGSEIEVALDEGRIAADGSARPIAELELELKRGSAADLFALARSLNAAGPLKIGVLTKSERGYRLASSKTSGFYKADPITMARGTRSADAVALILRACIRHFRLNEPFLIETRSAEPLHQARVALRRLRSALSFFKPLVADAEYEGIRRRLRALAGLLGEARNLDVFLERAAKAEGRPDGPDLDRVGRDREHAYDRVIESLASKRVRSLMLDLLVWVENGPWRSPPGKDARARLAEPIERVAVRLLDKRRRRVRKKGRDLAGIAPRERHRVRIEAKKLRYASEFFAGLVESKTERRRHKDVLEALQALQGCLGDLNDLATARDIEAGASQGSADDPARSTRSPTETEHGGEPDRREAELVACAVAAHGALAKLKPFWRAWA